MHVNKGFSVWVFGFGKEWCWEVGECPHLWWAPSRSLLVPVLSNLIPRLCGAITQTALLSPAVVFSFQGESRCVLVYVIKTEATSHSEEHSTLCSHRFNALIKELNKDGPGPAWESLGQCCVVNLTFVDLVLVFFFRPCKLKHLVSWIYWMLLFRILLI